MEGRKIRERKGCKKKVREREEGKAREMRGKGGAVIFCYFS